MRKFLLAMALTFVCGSLAGLHAQNVFSKGDNVVNFGVGLGSYYGGAGYKQSMIPLSVSLDHGVLDGLTGDGKGSLGIGGYLGYAANEWSSLYQNVEYGYKYSYIVLGARGSFHYEFVDDLDTYGGLLLGYNVVSGKYFGSSDASFSPGTASGIAYSLFVGARYYLADNIAIFGELGYGISALELGVALKF